MRTLVRDAAGTEYVLETGYGHVTKVEPPKEGGRNAHVEFAADGLRKPVKGWADSTNPAIWEPVNEAMNTGQRVTFRIEVHRDAKVDKNIPFDKVGQFDRFRRLVEVKPAGGATAQVASNNPGEAPVPAQDDPGPSDPDDYGHPFSQPDASARPRVQEGKPWERTNSDGSLNLGSYAYLASVGTVEWAYELLTARRAEKGLEGPASVALVKGLAAMLLDASDRAQAGIRSDGRVDRMDSSHTRARGAVRALISAQGVPWAEIAQPANRAGWVASLADQATELLTLALELDR